MLSPREHTLICCFSLSCVHFVCVYCFTLCYIGPFMWLKIQSIDSFAMLCKITCLNVKHTWQWTLNSKRIKEERNVCTIRMTITVSVWMKTLCCAYHIEIRFVYSSPKRSNIWSWLKNQDDVTIWCWAWRLFWCYLDCHNESKWNGSKQYVNLVQGIISVCACVMSSWITIHR